MAVLHVDVRDLSGEFADALARAHAGDEVLIERDGEVVARVVPCAASDAARSTTSSIPPGTEPLGGGKLTPEEADEAWAALLVRLRSQPARDIGPWTRDELYEDD